MTDTNEKTVVLQERYGLAVERIRKICSEKTVPAPFYFFFNKTAHFLLKMEALNQTIAKGETDHYSLKQWQNLNQSLYEDILPEHYDKSYGNPVYAVKMLGEVHGRILSFLYAELRGIIPYSFEQRQEEIVVLLELFIEIYNRFEEEELPEYKDIQNIVYWFVSDYSELFSGRRIREAVDPSLDFAVNIIMYSDFTDLRYLYKYGEYVSENELQTAAFLNSLPEQELQAMADTFTEGYRIGFSVTGKDISLKKTVNIRYQLGFEPMIRKAIANFERLGLKPVIYRSAVSRINKRQHLRIGFTGAVPNKQFEYDHRADNAIYLDRKYVERKLGAVKSAYESCKQLAREHGGPAVVEVFGEKPFVPVQIPEAYHLSLKQQKMIPWMDSELSRITKQYIPEEERSFTIIAYPVPDIGDQFREIFRETIKINTLDYKKYQRIQQVLIDALDRGKAVHILGKGANQTDLTIALQKLEDPVRQTLFENCVADVNIPLGEVFTSPKLKGTSGLLHVTQVYLNSLEYRDLKVVLKDGMVDSYGCSNFDQQKENQDYFYENVMYHHDTLPVGEFAIGTNTTAYAMGQNYNISGKLPILIAEKTGPHFALGDTCYSWAEDAAVYNPDGKEIIARENEVSVLRRENPSKAYFGCHTDITIPYEEIGHIEVICEDESRITLIEDGRFVLPGTEELNDPLQTIFHK